MYALRLILALVAITLNGCAVGQKFNYANTGISFGDMGAVRSVSVAVLDHREYVVTGDKSESFVGLSRGGFGNPFDVTTQSGTPMASEMATSIAAALQAEGLKVQTITLRSGDGQESTRQALLLTGYDRILLFTLNEWKTDTLAHTGLTFDVTLDVLDSGGRHMARSQVFGQEVSGASILSAEKDAQKWFAAKITELLRDPAVVSALQ